MTVNPTSNDAMTIRTCTECHRRFDMLSTDDAAEWVYGHDCEAA